MSLVNLPFFIPHTVGFVLLFPFVFPFGLFGSCAFAFVFSVVSVFVDVAALGGSPITLDTCLGVTCSPNSTINSIRAVLILSGSSSVLIFILWIWTIVFEPSTATLSVLFTLPVAGVKLPPVFPIESWKLSKVFESGKFNNISNKGFQEGYYPTSDEIKKLFEENGFNKLSIRSIRGVGYEKEDSIYNIEDKDMFNKIIDLISNTAEDKSIIEMCGHAIYIGCKK